MPFMIPQAHRRAAAPAESAAQALGAEPASDSLAVRFKFRLSVKFSFDTGFRAHSESQAAT